MTRITMNNDAEVRLWGTTIGAVTWDETREIGIFQYDPDFLQSKIQLSPLMMPLQEFPYEFPALSKNTFKGLPGLLADSLPDKFGNKLIDSWLATEGRTPSSFHPVERLCYIGTRGMGALEFLPSFNVDSNNKGNIEINKLVTLANKVLDERAGLSGFLSGKDDRQAIEDILRVGTSAGGARAKAIIAWNHKTNKFLSGQLNLENGFEHWLIKFDGILNNRDKELADPQGYGKIEYAYHLMANAVGIKMSECRLHNEGGRSHFMTKRFDRTNLGEKIHMQSLGAIAHYDYNLSASYSYEQAITVIKRLDLSVEDLKQQLLRAMFNVVFRNQDDHVKNIAFLMTKDGAWHLSPAFDLSYSWDPDGQWTNKHQMSINNKRDYFTREDLISLCETSGIKSKQANEMLDKVLEVAKQWPEFAEAANLTETRTQKIQKAFRLYL